MTDKEFEILDILYFTVPFEELQNELGWDEETVKSEVYKLIEKGWVKCLAKVSEEEVEDFSRFKNEYKNYNYLATKEGLFAHNSI
jgi:DNA-binding Lrp family transcriptional regulator